MRRDDPPAYRHGLFVDPVQGWLLDPHLTPHLIPLLLSTPPYHPAAPAPHHPCPAGPQDT